MWLFEAPKTYTEMCKKIAQTVFYITLIELFVLSQISYDFASLMKIISFNTETEIIGLKLYIAYIYVPIVVSVLENIFKLHDKIGKLFKLRQRYDGHVMFKAYIYALEMKIPRNQDIYKLYKDNVGLRKACSNHFYYYTSDTNPKIDAHDIRMALDAWCWVWILLDSIAISLLLCVTTIALNFFCWKINEWLIYGLGIYSVILSVLLFLQLVTTCKKYTTREVVAAVDADKSNGNNQKNILVKKEIKNALYNK